MYHQDVYFKDIINLIHSISTYKYRYMRKFEFFPKKKKGKHFKESINTIQSKTKIRIFYHFRQTSGNNIPYLVLSDQHFCCIHSKQSIRIHFINTQCLWLHMKKTWWMHRKYQPNKWKRLFNWWTKRSNFSDKTV